MNPCGGYITPLQHHHSARYTSSEEKRPMTLGLVMPTTKYSTQRSQHSLLFQLPEHLPAIFGHASVLLDDGRLIVFGGFSPSAESLNPLSQIWCLNTKTSPMAWSMVATSNTSLPEPRRAFAATLLPKDRVWFMEGAMQVFSAASMMDGFLTLVDRRRNGRNWSHSLELVLGGTTLHTPLATKSFSGLVRELTHVTTFADLK